jgi:hypothetical protein
MGQNFAWDFVTDDRMVMLHTEVEPTNEEWDGYLSRLKGKRASTLGLLVFTSGGAPNAVQRTKLNDWIGKDSYARAVLSDSMLVRGVITALAWFDPAIKAFSPSQLEEAYVYLKVPPAERAKFRATVNRLKAGMNLKAADWWAKL